MSLTKGFFEPPPSLVETLEDALTTFAKASKQNDDAFQTLMLSLLRATVHAAKPMHWWCNESLLPASIEMLHLFSLEFNAALANHEAAMDCCLSRCLDCSMVYHEQRKAYCTRLLDTMSHESVDMFVNRLHRWDADRLSKTLDEFAALDPTQISKEAVGLCKVAMCEVMMDPSLFLDNSLSGRISKSLVVAIKKFLSPPVRRFSVTEALPGLWILTFHQDEAVAHWARAVLTKTLIPRGASGATPPEISSVKLHQWNNWERYGDVWSRIMVLLLGGTTATTAVEIEDGTMPMATSKLALWKGVHYVIRTMSAELLRHIRQDKSSTVWTRFQQRLLQELQGSTLPSNCLPDLYACLLFILDNLGSTFWIGSGNNGAILFDDVQPYLIQILRPLFLSSFISGDHGVKRALVTSNWIVTNVLGLNSVSSMATKELVQPSIHLVLQVVGGRMSERLDKKDKIMDVDYEEELDSILWTDLHLILRCFAHHQKTLESESDTERIQSTRQIFEHHWNWIATLWATGLRRFYQRSPSTQQLLEIQETVKETQQFAKSMLLLLLDEDIQQIWHNYKMTNAKVEQVHDPKKRIGQPELWIDMAEAVVRDLSRPPSQDVIDSKESETERFLTDCELQNALECQTIMLEKLSDLALLPRVVTKEKLTLSKEKVIEVLNKDMEIVAKATSHLLTGLQALPADRLSLLSAQPSKKAVVKLIKLWCSSDTTVRMNAMFVMRSAWKTVGRPDCLRMAFEISGEDGVQELVNILDDWKTHGCPGGETAPALFGFLLEAVTCLFLQNATDGEGGLYLQIFLSLTSTQDVKRHLELIKGLWTAIWISLKSGFKAGRHWADQLPKTKAAETVVVLFDIGKVMIGEIGHLERLLEFENRDEGADDFPDLDDPLDDFDMDMMGGSQSAAAAAKKSKETMPLEVLMSAMPDLSQWIYARDSKLCSTTADLVFGVLNLMADHGLVISRIIYDRLESVAQGKGIATYMTPEKLDELWIVLSRHPQELDPLELAIENSKAEHEAELIKAEEETRKLDDLLKPQHRVGKSSSSKKGSDTTSIVISDDDFADIDDAELSDLDFDSDSVMDLALKRQKAGIDSPKATLPRLAVGPIGSGVGKLTQPKIGFGTGGTFSPSNVTQQRFGSSSSLHPLLTGSSHGSSRRLPQSITNFNLKISSKLATPAKKPVSKGVSKGGKKLQQMRSEHRIERKGIVDATQTARTASRLHRPTMQSESSSEDDSPVSDNGMSSLLDTEDKLMRSNSQRQIRSSATTKSTSGTAATAQQQPRRTTKLLELSDITNRPKQVGLDPIAARKLRQEEERNERMRLVPSLASFHANILSWDASLEGEHPPNMADFTKVPRIFGSPEAYISAFQPLLILECWQQLVASKDEVNQDADSVQIEVKSRVSIDRHQDISAELSMQALSGLRTEDIVVMAQPGVGDVFKFKGNANAPKPFLAKVESMTRAKGKGSIVLRTHLPITESSPLMHVRQNSVWKLVKLTNLTTVHREYRALAAIPYYQLTKEVLSPSSKSRGHPNTYTIDQTMEAYKVNLPQAEAIIGAVEKTEGFTLIQGPPGTGKTKTILGLVGALLADISNTKRAPQVQSSRADNTPLRAGKVSKLMICAPSNAAIDEIVKRLMGGIRNYKGESFTPLVVRIGKSDTASTEVKDVVLENMIEQALIASGNTREADQQAGEAIRALIEEIRKLRQDVDAQRVLYQRAKEEENVKLIAELLPKMKQSSQLQYTKITQLNTLKENQTNSTQKKEQVKKEIRDRILGEADVICATLNGSGHELLASAMVNFETVIIDEAAQAVEVSSLIPLKYGCKRCIMVGDPNQLPPTVISQLATRFDYNQSLFVRMQNVAPEGTHLLSIQYRMHPEISAFPSREFYQSKLKDGPEMAAKTTRPWHRDPLLRPYMFFNVQNGQMERGRGFSQYNSIEADMAVALVDRLCSENPRMNFNHRIGIISPYKYQVTILKQKFERRFGAKVLEAVDFNTVDGFQGQEKDVIIFSCVRVGGGNVGFLSDVRRMNVALTRARQSMFVLGHVETLRQDRVWGGLIRDAEERKLVTMVPNQSIFGRPMIDAPSNLTRDISEADKVNEAKLTAVVSSHGNGTTTSTAGLTGHGKRIERPSARMEWNGKEEDDEEDEEPLKSRRKTMATNNATDWSVSMLARAEMKRKLDQASKDQEDPRKKVVVAKKEAVSPTTSSPVSAATITTQQQQQQQQNPQPAPLQKHQQEPVETVGVNVDPTHRPNLPQPRPKAAPTLFLKRPDRSMKTGAPRVPPSQSDVKARLAQGVVPIRKSYPGEPKSAHQNYQPPRPRPKFDLDATLHSMDGRGGGGEWGGHNGGYPGGYSGGFGGVGRPPPPHNYPNGQFGRPHEPPGYRNPHNPQPNPQFGPNGVNYHHNIDDNNNNNNNIHGSYNSHANNNSHRGGYNGYRR